MRLFCMLELFMCRGKRISTLQLAICKTLSSSLFKEGQ